MSKLRKALNEIVSGVYPDNLKDAILKAINKEAERIAEERLNATKS